MELPGDSEEHFFKILARFQQNFGSFFDVFGQIFWPDFMELLQKMFSAQFSLPPKLVPDHLEAKRKRGGGVGRSPLDIYIYNYIFNIKQRLHINK